MAQKSHIINRPDNQNFGILVDNIKNGYNAGLLVRSASAYGASYVGWSGKRYTEKGNFENGDTEGFRFKYPIFAGVDNLKPLIPYKSVCVAVELCDNATSIFDFTHPKICTYILGAEDSSLSKEYLDICEHKIYIPTHHSLNLVHCATSIMFHRMQQMMSLKDDVVRCSYCGHNYYSPLTDLLYKCNACGGEFPIDKPKNLI
jgi:tRNA G18 (ribose-2'-O)-methylase SpoU